jgi:hypothetical protein
LLLATAAFFRLGHPWGLFLVLLLALGLNLLGLPAGPRVGAVIRLYISAQPAQLADNPSLCIFS